MVGRVRPKKPLLTTVLVTGMFKTRLHMGPEAVWVLKCRCYADAVFHLALGVQGKRRVMSVFFLSVASASGLEKVVSGRGPMLVKL